MTAVETEQNMVRAERGGPQRYGTKQKVLHQMSGLCHEFYLHLIPPQAGKGLLEHRGLHFAYQMNE